ncbi:hypothetical protein [Blastococcus sp. SYSU DS0617]
MSRYRTTTAMPFAHLHGATSALRHQLERQITADDAWAVADWSTLRVVGPIETFGPHGAVQFEYRGSVEPRRLAPLPNRAARTRH